jgi:hypothetical protein
MPEDDLRAELRVLGREIAGLTVTLARMDERTTLIAGLEIRVRALEEKLSTMSGIGRASAQGLSWALPVALALLGILGSVVTYLATHGR